MEKYWGLKGISSQNGTLRDDRRRFYVENYAICMAHEVAKKIFIIAVFTLLKFQLRYRRSRARFHALFIIRNMDKINIFEIFQLPP